MSDIAASIIGTANATLAAVNASRCVGLVSLAVQSVSELLGTYVSFHNQGLQMPNRHT